MRVFAEVSFVDRAGFVHTRSMSFLAESNAFLVDTVEIFVNALMQAHKSWYIRGFKLWQNGVKADPWVLSPTDVLL